MIKWTAKDAIRCLAELRDPFEEEKPKGTQQFPGLTEAIKKAVPNKQREKAPQW